MNRFTFIYNNTSCTKLYLTDLNYFCGEQKNQYEYDFAIAIKLNKYLQTERASLEVAKSTKAFTNISKGSNLFNYLRKDYQYLKYFNSNDLNLEKYLFRVKDLIIGRDLTFSSPYYQKKILTYFDKINDDLTSLNSGDNCFLLSLIYLVASIEQTKKVSAIGSYSFYSF